MGERREELVHFAATYFIHAHGGDSLKVFREVEDYYDWYFETHRNEPTCPHCGQGDYKIVDGEGPCGCV